MIRSHVSEGSESASVALALRHFAKLCSNRHTAPTLSDELIDPDESVNAAESAAVEAALVVASPAGARRPSRDSMVQGEAGRGLYR